MNKPAKEIVLSGAGGGGGKGGGGGGNQRTPQEAPNTLRSISKARIIDALGEGEIRGLVNGLKSVYLDGTPLQADNVNFNFQGVTTHFRPGLPTQNHIPGFPAVETAHDVSTEITKALPVVRTVSNLDADAVRVTVQLPALSSQDVRTGDLNGASVELAIDVRPAGGSWAQRRYDRIAGKTTSPYQRSYRVDLEGPGPWDIRVRRITADNEDSTLNNTTNWATYTEVVDAKLSYPDTALCAIEVDAQQFGNQIPTRAYEVYGLIVKVPSNYNPETREYTGFWNGTFKRAWTDNPAWCFYDMASHMRYGGGMHSVDKFALYEIGKYCDELVPDGYGGFEPRFRFNTVIADDRDVITALQTLANTFRGMTYWGTDSVMPVADIPSDPVRLVTPANVIGGEFVYEGTGLEDRHSVALVTYNDPNNQYKKQIEVVEDPDSIEKYGWKPINITAVACTSRGQAHRLGKWTLASERLETETVSYTASIEHASVRPGDLIKLSDPTTAGARLGGRIRTPGTSSITLDRRPPEATGSNWFLDCVLPNGALERRPISGFNGNRVTLSIPFSQAPLVNSVWMISSQLVEPRLFRVLTNKESDGKYEITALEHDPTKYGRIEFGLDLPTPEYSLLPTGPVVGPYSITAQGFRYLAGGTEHQGLTISWTPSDDPRVLRYIVEVQGPKDLRWRTIYTDTGTSVDIRDADPGQWMIRVRGVTGRGTASPWTSLTTNIAGLLLPSPPDSVDVETATFSITLRPKGLYPGQMWEFWRSGVALTTELIESNAVNVGVATQLTDTPLRSATTFFYYIRGINAYGVSSWYPVQATTEQNPADFLELLTGQIREGQLYKDLNEEIQKISGPESLAGSVTARVAAEAQARAEALLALDEEVTALVQQESNVRQEADSALAEVDSQLAAGIGEAFTSISSLSQVVADNDSAQTLRVDAMQSTFEENFSALISQQETFANEFESFTISINGAVSEVEQGYLAAVQEEANTRASADQTLAQQINTVQSEFNTTLTSVQQSFSAQIETVDGKVDANAEAITSAQTEWANALATAQNELTANINNVDGKVDANAEAVQSVQVDLGNGLTAVRVAAVANSGGVISGGQFATGDLSEWRNVWGGVSVVESNPDGAFNAIKTIPTKYAAMWEDSGHDAVRSINGHYFPVAAGESYTFKFSVASGGTAASIPMDFRIVFRRNIPGTVNRLLDSRTVTGTTWTTTPVINTIAPAGAVDAYIQVRRLSGSTGNLFVTNIVAQRTDVFASSQWTAQVQANGLVGGFGVYNDGQTVEAGFAVDKFWIGRNLNDKTVPFVVSNNRVIIDDALIDKLLFTKLRSSDGSLVFTNGRLTADYINVNNLVVNQGQSTNFLAGVRGWRLTTTGGEINFPISFNNVQGAGALASKDNLESLFVPDTRDDNHPPSWYYSNYPRQTITEFKRAAIIGISGEGTYVSLTTKIPWSGSTGGPVVQEVVKTSGVYSREGTTSSWSTWSKADQTSSNTSFDTARVAGVSSSLVEDRAFRGAVGSNTVNNWTRPTSTMINGNQIFTGDAYVDTLQIKGNAVTIPRGTFAAGARGVSSTDFVVLRQLSIPANSTGSPVHIQATFSFSISWSFVSAMGKSGLEACLYNVTDDWFLGSIVEVHQSGESTNKYEGSGTVCISFQLPDNWSARTVQLLAKRNNGLTSSYACTNRSLTAVTMQR